MTTTHDIEALLTTLDRAPRIIVPLVREVPTSVLKRRPRPGKWSAHEHACHLEAVHSLFLDRLQRMMAEDDPEIVPYDPGRDDEDDRLLKLDLDRALDRYARDRAVIVERLRGLAPSDWDRRGRHPEYGAYSIFIMFRHLAMHDMLHAYRIEELLLKRDWD
jgi:hypothetical protein